MATKVDTTRTLSEYYDRDPGDVSAQFSGLRVNVCIVPGCDGTVTKHPKLRRIGVCDTCGTIQGYRDRKR